METKEKSSQKVNYVWTKENKAAAKKDEGFKSLKYRNEIQEIFPMRPLDNSWEDDLKNKYKMVEDTCWDKGFEVWRSLPMRSELEQKLGIGNYPIRRTADFTRKERPEAYLPGFSARKAGPISRPRDSRHTVRVAQTKVVAVPKKKEIPVVSSGDYNQLTARKEPGGVLQDGVLRQT